VAWVNWKLVLVRSVIGLILTQDWCTFCAECAIGLEIILDAPNRTSRYKWPMGRPSPARHGPMPGTACNTLGVDHQLNSEFKIKHDRLSGDDNIKVNLWR
jgi:hypothetical protein